MRTPRLDERHAGFAGGLDSRIVAFPSCVAASAQPKYAPVVYGDYLMERIDKNYRSRATSRDG
ncbi:MAG: hypothetical protein WAL59_31595 [Roseiarcus sp.]